MDQCRPTEEPSAKVLQIEALDQKEPYRPIEPPGLEDYCRKISLPPSVSQPEYSFSIKYYDLDFLNSSMPLVIAATSDFAMSSGLAGALNREMSNSDFLFSQWKNVGEVVMTPMFGNRTHRRTYYMILAYTERHEVTERAMQQCLHDLAHVARNNEERNLALPLVDKWRNPIPKWYDAIHDAFSYSGIQIRVMENYYLSLP